MKFLNKLTMVLAKITEIVLWVGTVVAIGTIVITVIDFNAVTNFMTESEFLENGGLSGYGLDVNAISADGEINRYAVIIYFIGAILSFGLMAMVFRNVYLIMKKLNGKNNEIVSPFHKDIIRMTKEIGIFTIAVPVVCFILSIIATAISLANGLATEITVNISTETVMIALISFCLTNVFTYGASLEKDVDGLV